MQIRNTRHTTGHLLALAVMFGTGSALAAGFALYETSSRGIALGGATLGAPTGAETIYDNPAGMTDLPGSSLNAGLALINPAMDIDVTTPAGKKRYGPDDKWFPPPFAYYSQQMNDGLWLGFGLYSPYGLGVEHDADWPGRYNSVETLITAFNMTPTAAFKLSDSVSLAAGLQIMYFDITLKRALPNVPALLEIEGDSIGFGGTVAFSFKLPGDLALGLVYRSQVKQEVEGDASVGPYSVGAEGDITLPASYSAGLNYTGIDKWNVGAVATYTSWSSYDKLTMNFDSPALLGVSSSTSVKDWNDVWRFGFGAEYQMNEKLALQGGYVFDTDPIPGAHADYLLPPGDRHILSLGASYALAGDWKLGVAFAYLMLKDVDIQPRPAEGVFPTEFTNGDTTILSVSLAKNF
jgi:long-chain fatty acid transport protein